MLHAVRRAFIASESSARNSLDSKNRTFDASYENGDIVWYKRDRDGKWRGPGKVVIQDGKIIFVCHGATYVRLSANRLIKVGKQFEDQERENKVNDGVATKAAVENIV